ncbi:polyprenyl synthetase family protein [[Mycobacterium] wendilense]|uniref:Polyprenyl synthetase family protein n=1 Tax=[Mycobacterium] wendilense TaxID=3064284 RepID=A0ABN9P318_9MYCO|nr:polyprenyl synthetase family protein [Mycolicibacterium sp. MU0050]CAJ1585897.1 polyprenyl synthetase family protein [Mycolicibacterium sp. MU0050]
MADASQRVFLAAVDDHIRHAVSDELAQGLIRIDPELNVFADQCLAAATDGGKRLRPRFLHGAWQAFATAAEPGSAVVGVAAGLELLHAAILVHDDVIDSSDLRRNRPSVRAALAGYHRASAWSGPASVFGDHTAVLLGDLLWGTAQDLLSDAVSGIPEQRAMRVGQCFRAMRLEVIAGQLLELQGQAAHDFVPGAAEKIVRYKTTAYTVQRPMALGFELADAPRDGVALLQQYAAAVGEAFQLRDDLADLFAETEHSGKRSGDDIRSGKPTSLMQLALERSSDSQREFLIRVIGRADADAADIDAVKDVLVDTGAVQATCDRVGTLGRKARDALSETASTHPVVRLHALVELLALCTDVSFVP